VVTLSVTLRSGEKQQIPAQIGYSVMEAIRDAGIDEILALCGGCCSCSTCHVYIGDGFSDRVTPITEPEDDLLASSVHRMAQSRLSCQIEVTQALDGLLVIIAPAD
jgi:2Fe-2S ferredoxin